MSRQFILECLVDLPDDAFEQSAIIAKVQEPWAALVASLSSSRITANLRSEIVDRRPRKATIKAVTSPPLAAAE